MDERELTRPRHRSHSAVTSGRRLLIGGDPNSAWARRYRDLVTRHIGDMGGRDLLSEGELSLIRRASALECELEGMEARMSQGEQVNLELYGRLTDRLGRTLQRVGLKRRARDVGPSLADLTSSNLVGCCTGTEADERSAEKSWPHFRPSAVDFCGSRLAIGAATERARALAMRRERAPKPYKRDSSGVAPASPQVA